MYVYLVGTLFDENVGFALFMWKGKGRKAARTGNPISMLVVGLILS